jgi:hypothetical protein
MFCNPCDTYINTNKACPIFLCTLEEGTGMLQCLTRSVVELDACKAARTVIITQDGNYNCKVISARHYTNPIKDYFKLKTCRITA